MKKSIPQKSIPPIVGEFGYFDSRLLNKNCFNNTHWLVKTTKTKEYNEKNNVNNNVATHFSSKIDKKCLFITNHGKIISIVKQIGDYDSDEDGLFDSVEVEISAYSATISEALGTQVLNLNPEEEESIPGRKDLSVARGYLSQLQSSEINLGILVEGKEKFLDEATSGLAFLEEALENELWIVDFQEIAERTYEGDYDKAVRAVGIFNAYCARCHTAGYSAGAAYTKKIASGGLGPALRSGRANIQFKAREDMVDFIIKGSENGKGYGVNGVGGGKMPGFGAVLPESDIGLVIDYLRGMMPDA